MLTIADHRRDSAGLTYVYPVVSRRAGGVSIGINLNPNNACNWACVYCQVEGLQRGGPPPINVDQLEGELCGLLQWVTRGDFMVTEVPPEARQLMDIAFSGNGEPTSAREFPDVVARVHQVLADFPETRGLPLRLITNGSLLGRPSVLEAIATLGRGGGEVWFKVDRVGEVASRAVNGAAQHPEQVQQRIRACAMRAKTWIQTCWFGIDGQAPDEAAIASYCDFVRQVADCVAGVHLYGIARPSHQPQASHLCRLEQGVMAAFALRLEKETGIRVSVNP